MFSHDILTKRTLSFINFLFIILFGYYFILNLFGNIYKTFVLSVGLLFILLLPKINNKFKNTDSSTLNRILAIMNVISFVLILISALSLRTEYYTDNNIYSWDYGMVCDTALRYAKYGELCVVDPTILPRYPNNHCIIYFLYNIFKFINYIFPNLSDNTYELIAVIINCIFIEAAVIITLKLAKHFLSPKNVFICGCLIYTCIPIYAYSSFYYTDTLSLPFVVGLLYVYICFTKAKSVGKKISLTLLFSTLLVIGFQIKATVIFIAIAVAFDIIFRLKSFKLNYKHIIIVILSFIVLNSCLSSIYSKTFKITEDDYNAYKYPVTHWVMMALNPEGNGSWVRSDDFLTRNAGDYDDKINLNINQIRKRIDDLGVSGIIKHIFYTKATHTWASGTLSADLFLSMYPKHQTILHKFFTFTGKYYLLYNLFSVLYHGMLMFLITISAIKRYKEKNFDKMEIFFLPILMLALFLMIWESDARYIFHMMPLMIIVAADSFDLILEFSEKLSKKYLLET